ncbi:DMT family transporter [Ruixingdingia sedimenti]|uniref:DMT family transporter n=1 Tax=Ruixingdingia sedimenti TaxID=3073604 RepID=A0ABU1F5Z9_9RHOB|nr:DMT family transporter [Xinfangfangia sp. LG-4]MDR5652306.1 DMT family transporter [Xinfangfangia sp. LG-4]
MSAQSMRRSDWLLLCLLALLWGVSFFFIAVVLPSVPAFTLVTVRLALAALALAGVMRLRGIRLPRGARAWGGLAMLGLLNNALPFSLVALAQGTIDSGLASVLNATVPLFTVVLARIATSAERLTPARLGGVAAGMAGVAVMVGSGALSGGPGQAGAQMLSLAAAFFYATGTVFARRIVPGGLSPVAMAFGQLSMATLLLLPLSLLFDAPWTLPMPPPHALAALVVLALMSTAGAYLIYFRLLISAGPVNLQLVTFMIPVTALLLGVLVLGEVLVARQIAGMALIALGLVLIDGRLLRRR